MFSFFKKEKSPSYLVRDMVWKTKEAAEKGMLMLALRILQQKQPALIFTFFEDEKQGLGLLMKENNITYKELNALNSREEIDATSIYLVGEDDIESTGVMDFLKRNSAQLTKVVLFNCHYPIISEEDKMLGKLYNLGFSDFIFCLSFDDPLLDLFKGRVVPLLERLGLDENESIEHGMVTSSLKNARKKISEKVKAEKKAKSAKEWYTLNVKPD